MNHIQNPQEIHEAINAADDALIALRNAERSLASAGGWGLWDMFGGGFLTTMFKHGKIDQAQQELQQARHALRRFRNELADLNRTADFDLEIGEFLRFADYVFDGFLADWMVQSRIQQGREKINQAIHQVESIRRQLWSMLG